jgi:hypothetical protein
LLCEKIPVFAESGIDNAIHFGGRAAAQAFPIGGVDAGRKVLEQIEQDALGRLCI